MRRQRSRSPPRQDSFRSRKASGRGRPTSDEEGPPETSPALSRFPFAANPDFARKWGHIRESDQCLGTGETESGRCVLSPHEVHFSRCLSQRLSHARMGGRFGRAEGRMINEQNLILDLFQQAPGFMALTLGENHVIQFANDAYFSLVGDRDVVGKSIREAVPELEGQGIFELLDKAYQTGTPFVGREVPIALAREGARSLETRHVDMVFQPIKRDGAVVGIFSEGYDVSEQKKAKDELLALQTELMHVSRVGAMSAMAATLAHELNQPLTAIKAFLGGARRLLEHGIEGLPEAKRAIADASAATTRAGDIIKRIRRMVSRGEPEVEFADLGLVVREAVALASSGVAYEGVVTSLDIAEGVPVNVDKVQIQQVILNLYRNAVAATASCDRREIRISVSQMRGAAVIEVDDTGPGIGPDNCDNIFAPLFTTNSQGLGVGLAISRTIIEAHRGKIWASASPLGGARLNIRLPLAPLDQCSNGNA